MIMDKVAGLERLVVENYQYHFSNEQFSLKLHLMGHLLEILGRFGRIEMLLLLLFE